MELDNLKKSWQEADIKPTLDEDKIQYMINNKGHSAFNSLLKYEKLGIIVAILCLPLTIVFRDLSLIILYFVSIPILLIWQIYKYKYLKNIDLSTMNVLEVSKKVAKYKKYILIEFFVGIAWAIIFCLLFVYRTVIVDIARIKQISVDQIETSTILLWLLGIFLFLAIITVILYKFLYMKNIKRIESSIKEIQEFEEEYNN